VAELVDATDLKSVDLKCHPGSIPGEGTTDAASAANETGVGKWNPIADLGIQLMLPNASRPTAQFIGVMLRSSFSTPSLRPRSCSAVKVNVRSNPGVRVKRNPGVMPGPDTV
jgi:hypothetical protein